MEINNTDVENLSAWIASQNDELERLRAFARDVLRLDCPGFQAWQKACVAEKHGITEEYLKAPE